LTSYPNNLYFYINKKGNIKMTRCCKTCGSSVGQYGYGGKRSWRDGNYVFKRSGKIAKDNVIKSIPSEYNPRYNESEKKVEWNVPPNERAIGMFCKLDCLYTFMEERNEHINSLPNLHNL
tara:strand:- start:154 stop:513 length:360 start_codon:yes stop_codon:yes gene_type:complete